MASPFRVFRKKQKVMIAALAILTMFAFVILPNLDRAFQGRGSAADNPVMIEWTYGEIRSRELFHKVQARRILQAFLNDAAQLGVYASGQMPGTEPVIDPRTNVNERDTVQTLVLATAAEEMGFVIGDAAINHYLMQLTNNSVDAAQLRGLVASRYLGNRRMTMNMMFDVLRTELLAQQLFSSYIISAQGVTPAERWESWKRWNDFATIETLPVPVEKFLDQVKAPTDDDLRTLFDMYKDRIEQPDVVDGTILESPLPGFRVPRKMAFHYLKADYDDFVARVAEEITDEEIAKYYEDNKGRLFVRATLFEDEEPKQETETEETGTEETDEAKKQKAGDASTPESEDGQPHSESDQAPETGDGQQGNGQQGGVFEEGNDTRQASQHRRIHLTLASYQEDEEADSQAESSDVESPETDTDDNQNADTEQATGQEEPSGEPKTEESQVIPLEEVQDEIRKTFAQQRAAERMEDVLKGLVSVMRDYAEQISAWESNDADSESSDDAGPRPEVPDMQAIAQEHGLEFQKTVLLSYFELDEMELGQSVGVLDGQRLSFTAFSTALDSYLPLLTKNYDGNHRYLAWMVEESPAVEAQMEDIRDEVERVWRIQKARQLARDEAQRLADQVTQSGQTLRQFFSAEDSPEVSESDPFSWLTIGSTPVARNVRLRLSEVAGVDGAGSNFMQAVFHLKTGEVGVAMNHAQTVAYVVRVDSHRITQRQLQDNFLLTSMPAAAQVRQANLQNILSSLLRDLEAATDLHWVLPPDQPIRVQ